MVYEIAHCKDTYRTIGMLEWKQINGSFKQTIASRWFWIHGASKEPWR